MTRKTVKLTGFSTLLFFLLWIVLSGRFDTFHLVLGIIASVITAVACRNLIFQSTDGISARLVQSVRLCFYLVWLIVQIFKANIHVLKLAFSKNVYEILAPRLVAFDSILETELERFILASSITLTPGTVVVELKDEHFLVHAISDEMARDLPGEMEQRVAAIFRKRLV
ncbi:MAG: cation transporter [Candidatus Dadabacteria bacterium]|nr:MAG: cation transporter [Candidatus Dadabacteria bacterium]